MYKTATTLHAHLALQANEKLLVIESISMERGLDNRQQVHGGDLG